MIEPRISHKIDWFLIVIVLVIGVLGILNIYSAAQNLKIYGFSYAIKQLIWFILGFLILAIFLFTDYHLFDRHAYFLYGIVFLLLASLPIFGKVSSGARRWIELGPITIQPTEMMKLVLIITLAKFFEHNWEPTGFPLYKLWKPCLAIVVPALFVFKQPDLGSALLLCLIGFSIILFARVKLKSFLLVVVIMFPIIFFGWNHVLHEYQRERVMTFLNPGQDPLGAGYHAIQSKIAVGSGKLFGKGFLKGTQAQLRFLPEQHTDFVFSVWAEEWGFVGALILLLLYTIFLARGISISYHAKDRFGVFLSIGIVAMVFWQVAINIGMVIGIFPVVGITLPLFSYGGSSLIVLMASMGLLLDVGWRRHMF